MRTLMIAVSLLVLPFAAQAEYDSSLTPRQAAVRNLLLDNLGIEDRKVMAEVKKLLTQAEEAARAGKEREADDLIGQAMMVVANQMFLMDATKSDQ